MLVLWRKGSERFPGHIQGLATSLEVARELVEGVPNVFAAEFLVDEPYDMVESWEDFDTEDWTRLTDEYGIWMKWDV